MRVTDRLVADPQTYAETFDGGEMGSPRPHRDLVRGFVYDVWTAAHFISA